jgi:hypothetical protein
MPEKRTEIRVARPGFRRDQAWGARLIEVPVDPVRSIVIRSLSGRARFADRKSPETIRNACRGR